MTFLSPPQMHRLYQFLFLRYVKKKRERNSNKLIHDIGRRKIIEYDIQCWESRTCLLFRAHQVCKNSKSMSKVWCASRKISTKMRWSCCLLAMTEERFYWWNRRENCTQSAPSARITELCCTLAHWQKDEWGVRGTARVSVSKPGTLRIIRAWIRCRATR